MPKNDSGMVSRFGNLVGLDGIPSRRHLDLLPYATARSEFSGTAEPGDPFNDGRTGAARRRPRPEVGLHQQHDDGRDGEPRLRPGRGGPGGGEPHGVRDVLRGEAGRSSSRARRRSTGSAATAPPATWASTGPTRRSSTRAASAARRRAPAAGEYVDRPSATTILGAAKLTGKTSRGWTVNFIDAATAREFADTATGDARGPHRGGAAHQLPRDARAAGRRPAGGVRRDRDGREPRPAATQALDGATARAARSCSAATATGSSRTSATTS